MDDLRRLSISRHARALRSSCLALVPALAVVAPARSQVQYSVTPLPDPPGAVYTVEPRGLNDRGECVGWVHIDFADPVQQAWLWTPSGGTVLLPPTGLGNYGAFDIDNEGRIAGDSTHPSGEEAWIYEDGAYEVLPLLDGETWAEVTGLNAAGAVVGRSDDYTPEGVSEELYFHGPDAGLVEIASDTAGDIGRINGPGRVVLNLAGDAYVWSVQSGLQLVGDFPGLPCASAKAIHDGGELAGTSWDCTQGSNRVVWRYTAAGWEDIVDLTTTSRSEKVHAMNSLGVVVGYSELIPRTAWVWSEALGVRILNDVVDPTDLPSSFYLYEAVDVNDSGQILAVGRSVTGNLHGAFLLTPIGDPRIQCVGKTNSEGCTPAIAWSGTPTAGGADDFVVEARHTIEHQSAILIWSRAEASTPFQGGTLCLAPPITRSPVLDTGTMPQPGPHCSGNPAFHFGQAYMASHSIAPGDQVQCQIWSRDPDDPFGSSLSNALSFTVEP